MSKNQPTTDLSMHKARPTQLEAEEAVKTLILWAGDNPEREGLKDTPRRVTKAYRELFAGYDQDPAELVCTSFKEVSGYQDPVLLRNIPFFSHCEHHMIPFRGVAHIAYLPSDCVLGLSKIARIVDFFAKRLQTQEALTAQIGDFIQQKLNPKGIALLLEAEHMCMVLRGVKKPGATTMTTRYYGVYQENESLRQQFLNLATQK